MATKKKIKFFYVWFKSKCNWKHIQNYSISGMVVNHTISIHNFTFCFNWINQQNSENVVESIWSQLGHLGVSKILNLNSISFLIAHQFPISDFNFNSWCFDTTYYLCKLFSPTIFNPICSKVMGREYIIPPSLISFQSNIFF